MVGLVALVWLGAHAVRYVVAGKHARPVLGAAWRIKYTWWRTARRVGLVQIERHRPSIWSATPYTTVITRELLPAITVHTERWGVRVDASTIGRLGVKEFTDAAGHLADVWRVPLVRVEQTRPGRVRLRALLSGPLTEPSPWTDAGSPIRLPSSPAVRMGCRQGCLLWQTDIERRRRVA